MVEPISQEHFSTLKRTVMLPNGLRLAYIEMGDPNGMPVLLLHGFTDSARSWSLAAPYLAAGFGVVAPDLRGQWCSGAVLIDEDFLAHARRESAALPSRIWHSIYYEQLAYDPSPLLQDISAATLILRGEKDTIATEEHQAQMKDAIDGAELISVPGHGHNIHWEAPEKVAHLILTFLERP